MIITRFRTDAPMRTPRSFLTILLVVVAMLFSGRHALAGEGTISGGKLNMLVYFEYDEMTPATWEPVLTAYSKSLSNATEGGLQLGTISFTKCADLKAEADIWIREGTGGASAHRNGLGTSGLHMFISQVHKSTSGAALGQFGLVHESGHYIWGCHDEYKGYVGNTAANLAAHYCSTVSGTVACPMDGGTTVGPNNTRTEFCTKASLALAGSLHNKGSTNGAGMSVRTKQEYHLAQSCWERMVASGKGGLTAPTMVPSTAQPAHTAVTYDYSRYQGTLAMALVIDRSGSMGSENKMQLAINGAQAGVGLMKDGEHISVVSFSSSPGVTFPATTIVAGTKTSAINAIGTLFASGGTVIGTALNTAISQLGTVQGCKEIIVLLTDGISSNPDADDPAVIAALIAGGHKVYSIALGTSTDDAPLTAVAAATGGKFFKATTASQLPNIFSLIFAEAVGGTPASVQPEQTVVANQTLLFDFDISSFASSGRVVINKGATANLGLLLMSPGGTQIDAANPPAGVSVFASDVQITVTVPAPEDGTWSVSVTEQAGVDTDFDFLAFVESSGLQIDATLSEALVTYPAPAALQVSVVAGVPVGGAQVTGVVTRPDASTVPIEFLDDGLAAHGDETANDGIYSTLFFSYNSNGSYTIDIQVVNTTGEGASELECFVFGCGEEGLGSSPIDPFTACISQTVVVQGFVPVAIPVTAVLAEHAMLPVAGPINLNSSPPTAVAGFVVTTAGDEPLMLADLTMDFSGGSDASMLERLSLHNDLDGNGELDVPSLPLAMGQVVGGQLLFSQGSGQLAVLDSGMSHSFLIIAGDGPVALAESAPVAPAPGGPGWRGYTVVGVLFLVMTALWFGLRRALEPSDRRRWALAASLVLASVAVVGCSRFTDGGSDHGGGAYTVSFDPGDLSGSGAVTSNPVMGTGTTLEFDIELL
ncbi:MAG: calcium-activated chloride channel regulator 4 [Pseudohongiellaceae bacterium]|jgi:calcium-activated chloride channel regulator 4